MQKAGGYPPPYVKSRTRSASRLSKSITLLHRRIEASSQAPCPASIIVLSSSSAPRLVPLSIISAICASEESNTVFASTPARVFIFSHKRRFIRKLPPPITDDGSIYFPLPILKKRFKNGFMIRGLFQITTFIKNTSEHLSTIIVCTEALFCYLLLVTRSATPSTVISA